MTTTTCATCQAIPEELFGDANFEYRHLAKYSDLKDSAKTCHPCAILCTTLEWSLEGYPSDANDNEGPLVLIRRKDIRDGPPLSCKCGRLSGIVTAEIQKGLQTGTCRSIAATADDPSIFQAVSACITECLKNHALCPKHDPFGPFPTRLIDVGPSDGCMDPKLCKGDECSAFDGKYLALSYCWGTGLSVKTTTANFQQMKMRIQLAALPQTLQDAIFITRKLGVRHIWIDSLCIIQDDKADWAREAATMSNVYSKSLCTIAALSSSSCDDGILKGRNKLKVLPATLHPSSDFAVTLYPGLPTWRTLDNKSSLNSRGWTLQERELPPRIVYFTISQTAWQCLTTGWIENTSTAPGHIPIGNLQAKSSWIFNGNAQREAQKTGRPEDEVYETWYMKVSDYSNRRLSYQTDKLVAIAGIAKKANEQILDTYAAGLWKKDILHGLLWACCSEASTKLQYKRNTQYIAPSWSWASIEGGPIWYEGTIFSRKRQVSTYNSPQLYAPTVTGLNLDMNKNATDSFGQLTGGFISLRGRVRLAKCSLDNADTLRAALSDGGPSSPIGWLKFDVEADASQTDVYCLFIFDWDNAAERVGGGIGLVSTTPNASEYRRVGYIDWIQTSWFDGVNPSEVKIM